MGDVEKDKAKNEKVPTYVIFTILRMSVLASSVSGLLLVISSKHTSLMACWRPTQVWEMAGMAR